MDGLKMSRSEEHTSELQSLRHLVCRLLLEKKKHVQRLQAVFNLTMGTAPFGTPVPDRRPSPSRPPSLPPGHPPPRLSPKPHLFFFNDTATTEIYTLSLHDALPIWYPSIDHPVRIGTPLISASGRIPDRKSTRLNSSHLGISYAVFCLKKNKPL